MDAAHPSHWYGRVAQVQTRFQSYGRTVHRSHFHAYSGVSVTLIPPVMPYIGLNGDSLSLAKDARLSAPLHGQLTFKNCESLDDPGMAVFADDAGSDTREKLRDRATLGVLIGKFNNRGALPCNRVFPNLADLDRRTVQRLVRVRMRHENTSHEGQSEDNDS